MCNPSFFVSLGPCNDFIQHIRFKRHIFIALKADACVAGEDKREVQKENNVRKNKRDYAKIPRDYGERFTGLSPKSANK